MNNKKIILQIYINENLGDDLFLDIISKRYPDTKFVVFGIGDRKIPPIYNNKYSNVEIVKFRNNLFRYFNMILKVLLKKDCALNRYLKDADGMVILGGSVFIDSPLPFEAYKSKLLAKVRTNILKVNKPMFVIGANFGPVFHDSFKSQYKFIFQNSVDVCFRDSNSKKYFNNLENVRKSTDVIFCHKNEIAKTEKNSVAISIIDLSDKSHKKIAQYQSIYENNMIRIINEFVDANYIVNLYSFCCNQGDCKAIDRILNQVKNKEFVFKHYYSNLNISSFIRHFSSNEYVLATRFHSLILGLKNKQKVYSIIYDQKTRDFLKDLNISTFCELNQMESLELGNIINAEIYTSIDRLVDESNNQFIALDEFLMK